MHKRGRIGHHPLGVLTGCLLLLCSGAALASQGFDWDLPGPDGSDPLGRTDPLEPIHWLLSQEDDDQVFFGELACLASSRGESKTQGEDTSLAASNYSWLLGGCVGDAADWILMGRTNNADSEHGWERVDSGYLDESEGLLRIALRPSPEDRIRITGRYGRNFRRPVSFYEMSTNGNIHPPLEIRQGQFLDLHWSRTLTASSYFRFWTGYSEDEWSHGAMDTTERETKLPRNYDRDDFDAYEDGIQTRYSLAGDLTLESWLAHRIVSGFQLQNLGVQATTSRVDQPDLWPEGLNQAWVSDVDLWLTRFYVTDRWQGMDQVVLEPRLEVVRYDMEQPWSFLTPSMRLSYSPASNTVLTAGVGYEVRPPSFEYLYEEAANDYTTQLWGDPERTELNPEKAQRVDLGMEQVVVADVSLGVKASYQWIEDVILVHDLWGFNYDSDPRTSKYYYWNGSDASAWSVTTQLRRRMSERLAASAEYVFGEAVGSLEASPGWLDDQKEVEFPDEFYLDWDVRHQVRLKIDYNTPILGGLAANLSWAWNSGIPYTPRGNHAISLDGSETVAVPEFNSARLPVWNELDLSVIKDVQLNDWVDLAVNVQVQNLLNHRNIREINNDTGLPEPQAFVGNVGTSRTFLAGLVLKF